MGALSVCSVSGCGKRVKAKGLCIPHYTRLCRGGDPLAGGPFRQPLGDICKVDDCKKKPRASGYCDAHKSKFDQYGDPLAWVRPGPLEAKKFADRAVHFVGDECLLWPYGKSCGYGSIRANGRSGPANRYVCEQAHGKPPATGLEAAHSCGNRACVNPRHLRWATPKENSDDKILHGRVACGERSSKSKLTESQVREIKYSVDDFKELAERFNISLGAIYHIKSGTTWRHV